MHTISPSRTVQVVGPARAGVRQTQPQVLDIDRRAETKRLHEERLAHAMDLPQRDLEVGESAELCTADLLLAENLRHQTEDVPHADPDFLVALAAFVRRKSRERAMAISGQLPGYGVKVGHDFSVITLDDTGQHRYTRVHVDEVVGQLGSAVVTLADKKYAITSHSRLNDICISGECNGQPFTAQIERGTPRNPLAMLVQHNGTRIETMVVSPRMAELYQKMPFKPAPDMSKYVLSPMPGLLVDVAVQVGQKVQAGERVAVIEAMKMENVLFAAADGIVGKVLAAKGDNLTVDQPIVEFA